jgi:hypothetical protein
MYVATSPAQTLLQYAMFVLRVQLGSDQTSCLVYFIAFPISIVFSIDLSFVFMLYRCISFEDSFRLEGGELNRACQHPYGGCPLPARHHECEARATPGHRSRSLKGRGPL